MSFTYWLTTFKLTTLCTVASVNVYGKLLCLFLSFQVPISPTAAQWTLTTTSPQSALVSLCLLSSLVKGKGRWRWRWTCLDSSSAWCGSPAHQHHCLAMANIQCFGHVTSNQWLCCPYTGEDVCFRSLFENTGCHHAGGHRGGHPFKTLLLHPLQWLHCKPNKFTLT